MNFHMNGMKKIMTELYGMLKTTEDSINKHSNHVMMVQKEKKKRKCSKPPKGKDKEKVSDETSNSKPKTKGKSGPSNEECFHCHKKGHWFRNCKKYFEEQKKKKGSETSASGIKVIEINITLSSSDSCIFDTGSMIHTCKSLWGLSFSRRFTKSELDVCVGNGSKVAAIVVSTYHLPLPSGLVLELNNCYYILALCKNIICFHVWRKLMVMRL
jgi:hypothetical protein